MVALRKSDFAGGRAGEAERPSRDEISSHLFADETRHVGGLIERAVFTEDERRRVMEAARGAYFVPGYQGHWPGAVLFAASLVGATLLWSGLPMAMSLLSGGGEAGSRATFLPNSHV